MEFSRKSFVTPDEILADVLKSVGDEDYRHNSKGWYISQMQEALEELSFDTLFNTKVLDFAVPQNLNLDLPAGTFNIKQLYVFNGDLCNISSKRNLWPKRNYFTKGNGYLARNTASNNDPFYSSLNGRNFLNDNQLNTGSNFHNSGNENTYYYNVYNGVVMLSPACRTFQKIAMVINGTGCEIGELPIIPNFFRQAVKDWVCEISLRNRLKDEPQLINVWRTYEKNLNYHENYGFYTGSWYKAKERVRNMGSHEREAIREYLAKPAW
jgi:hypothetical protein